MRRLISFAFLLLLLLMSVNAQETTTDKEKSHEIITNHFHLTYDVMDTRISDGEDAEILVHVESFKPYSQRFRIRAVSSDWEIIRTEPTVVRLSGLKIPGDSKQSFRLFLRPTTDHLRLGQHDVLLSAFVEGAGQERLIVPTYVEPTVENKKKYRPSLGIRVHVDEQLDPREELKVEVDIENLNKLFIEDLTVKVEGNLITDERSFSIDELGKENFEFTQILDPKLPPQTDKLTITFSVDGEIVKTFRRTVNVIDYTGPFVQHSTTESGFLKTRGAFVYTNDGNTEQTQTVMLRIPFWKNLFTSTSPKASLIKKPGDGHYLGWELTLAPGQSSTEISIVTSYRLFFFAIFAFVCGLVYYYVQKSPIIVHKMAVSTEKKEGGIAEVKVTINIKNPTKNQIPGIKIRDYVPHIARIVNEFKVGTLRPDKILRHEKHGDSLIVWSLEGLDPYEDRILTYRVRPQLSVVGDIILKPAVIKYHKKGKTVRVESNSVTVVA